MGVSLAVTSGGPSLVVVHGLLIAVASLTAERVRWGTRASVVVVRGLRSSSSLALEHKLSSCDTRA